jgi:hypothetical protein
MRLDPVAVVLSQGLLVGLFFGGVQRTIYGNGIMQSLCCFFVADLAIAGGPEAEEAPRSFVIADHYDSENARMLEAEVVPDFCFVADLSVESTTGSLPEAEETPSLSSVADLSVDCAATNFTEVHLITTYAIIDTLDKIKKSWAVALAVRLIGNLLADSKWLNISVSTSIFILIIVQYRATMVFFQDRFFPVQ